MPALTHDEMAHDLAVFLSRPLALNPSIGKPWGEHMVWENRVIHDTGCRPDIFAIRAVHNLGCQCPTTFEIKVTEKDYWADVRKKKWENYLQFSSRVVFAVPEGLVDASEIPEGAGLIVRKEKGYGRKRDQPGWKWVIKPRCKPNPLTIRHWVALCLKGRNLYPFEIEEIRGDGKL